MQNTELLLFIKKSRTSYGKITYYNKRSTAILMHKYKLSPVLMIYVNVSTHFRE